MLSIHNFFKYRIGTKRYKLNYEKEVPPGAQLKYDIVKDKSSVKLIRGWLR